MNEELNNINDGNDEELPSLEDLELRYTYLSKLVAKNADDILKRRLGGEAVTKDDTENQELMAKDLKRMGKAIAELKKSQKVDKAEDMNNTLSEIEHDMSKVVEKVKMKKSSIAGIVQKIQ